MSRTIHTIVVPLDLTESSQTIADWAIEWGERARARLVLLHVLPPVHVYAGPVFIDPAGFDEQYFQARQCAEERLRPIADQARECGVEATVHVRVGSAAEEILVLARDFGADLIVIGTHGRKGLAHVVLGSTAEKVVRLAPCPVFVVKESHAHAGAKVEVGAGATE
jgi:nucleotide-binding universal stress UspA family protein